jgi:hypothetical protein
MTFDISFVQSANALERHISAGSRIRKLLLRRYKTFYDEGIDLGNIVVLIGANASGKSNVVSAIDLIARLGGNTASDAVTSIGGVPSVRSGLVEESGSRINVSAAFGQTEVRLGLYLECVRHFEADIEELKRKTKRKATRFTLKGGEQGERILDKKSFYDLIGNMSGSMEKGTNEPFSQRVTFGAYTGLPFWGVEVVGTEARTSIELYGKGERDSDSSVWAETKRFDRPSTLLASELHLHRMRLRGYLPKRIVDYGKEDEIALAGILEDLLSASRVRLAPSDEVDCGIEAIFEDAEGKPLAAADRLRSHFDTLVTPFSTIELPLNSIVSRENQEYIFGLLKETYPEAKEEGFPYLYKEFAAFSTNRRLKEIASKGKRYFDGFNTSPFGDGLLPSSVDLIRPEFVNGGENSPTVAGIFPQLYLIISCDFLSA